jgi:hypothetical protein
MLRALGSVWEHVTSHKKKYIFLSVLGTVGYVGFRAYRALEEEMRRIEDRMRKMASEDSSVLADAPEGMRREQLFVQGASVSTCLFCAASI